MKLSRRIRNFLDSSSVILRPSSTLAFLLAITCLFLALPRLRAQKGNEKTFSSPGTAVLALYDAAKTNDQAALSEILGNSAGALLHTGDDVADKNMVQNFLRRYEQMHRVVIEPDGTATLYIGAENWPFPVSIVKNSSGAWYFDAENGKQEILFRRVGANENHTIETCEALVDAQHEYAANLRSGESSRHYAMKFLSDPGKQNGLFWKSTEGEPLSPIGPLIVQAAAEGYTAKQGQPIPYHGYYYRILTKQGSAARGGSENYLAKGKLVRGFAFLAYPAQYKNSGVMTFLVNQDGIVFEKDLGPETQRVATSMTAYNPDSSWEVVER
ncbi:MAG TPA: DUF2950 domain-containing protein [Terriglobales bacterium]|nr:DUF2950 domain-containing protein [Terriglobales bacterium]